MSQAGPRVDVSELDTKRFGVPIARVGTVRAADVPAVVAGCRAAGVAMAVIRTDARDLAAAHAVESAGAVLCDTLVYFARSLSKDLPAASPELREASRADADCVAAIAAAAFAGYVGHYHADPRLDRGAADATYTDWARRSCAIPGVADRVWVVEDAGCVAGFLTLRVNGPTQTEIVLNAVHPDHQKRGLYARLVTTALAWSRGRAAASCIVSTQLSNFAVQRSWVRLGFEPSHAFNTFHLWLTPR